MGLPGSGIRHSLIYKRLEREIDRSAALERQVAELQQQLAVVTAWLHAVGDAAGLSTGWDAELVLHGIPARPNILNRPDIPKD